MLRRQQHSVADDDALLFQPFDAALYAGARPPDQPRQLRGRRPAVLSQGQQQLFVDGIHGNSPVLPY